MKERIHDAFSKKISNYYFEIVKGKFESVSAETNEEERCLDPNQFLTKSDLFSQNFSTITGVRKVLHIDNQYFTPCILEKILIPSHIPLMYEYSLIIFQILLDNDIVFNNQCTFSLECNVDIKKNGAKKNIRLERKNRLYDLVNGIPKYTIDIWTDLSHKSNISKFVTYHIYHPDPQYLNIIYKQFYKIWIARIGISYTDDESKILLAKKEGLTSKQISKEIVFSKKVLKSATIDDKLYKMVKHSNQFILDTKKRKQNPENIFDEKLFSLIANEKEITNAIQLVNFCEKYSLFNPLLK